MNTITFTCEVLTPMFLGNATNGAELRPPAVKAALRFWWRAIHADLRLHEMYEKETLIFGGGGDKAQKSSFDIIMSDFGISIEDYKYPRNGQAKKIEGVHNNHGIEYLFYTFLHLKKEGKYIKPESKFEIKFIFYNDNYIDDVLSAFWLLAHLGNLGSRSRRGAGSFKVNEIIKNGIDEIKLKFKTDNVSDIKKFYEDNISEIKQLLKIGSIINNTHSHILDATIYFSNSTHDNWQSALNEIGEAMMKSRLIGTGRNATSRLNDDESAAFGLPVKHKGYSILPKDYKRRASPIVIKIIKRNNQYFWIVIHFAGEFLPYHKRILLKKENNGNKTYYDQVDDNKLHEFLKDEIITEILEIRNLN